MSALVDSLRDIVGESNVITGDAIAQKPRNHWDPSPLEAMAIVRPGNTVEVSAVLKACHAARQSVVTHGGMTGLVDGDRCSARDIVLSMTRMNHIESVDRVGQTMTVEAGCVLDDVHVAAAEKGLLYGLDLGARGSCTIGGNISTNAGGLAVLRYGMTREQILGLEAVLADGTVVSSMNRMLKNNAGYDLKQLFIGSEGTLGVVTRAVLRLRADTPCANTAMLAFDNYRQVTDTLAFMSASMGGQLNAYEVLWNRFYQLATDATVEGSVRAPLSGDYPIYAIVETRGSNPEADQQSFEQALEIAMQKNYFVDAVIPQSEKDRADLWSIRENVDMVLSYEPRFIYDVSLPVVDMERYLDDVEKQLKLHWPEVAFYAYGHLADGNLHLIVAPIPQNLGAKKDPVSRQPVPQNTDEWLSLSNNIIYQPLQKLGGSVSAEHGIGLDKKPYIGLSRNVEELALMKQLKQSLDPHNILNPGKIV